MIRTILIITLIPVLLILLPCSFSAVITEDAYWKSRNEFIKNEAGFQLSQKKHDFSEKENFVNDLIMEMKRAEFQRDPFLPGIHFFQAYREIEKTPIFDVLKDMPKGGALHIHDPSLVSTQWLINNITYRPGLYWCQRPSDNRVLFHFHTIDESCDWRLVNESRKIIPDLDELFTSQLTLEVEKPYEAYPDLNAIWKVFWAMFDTVTGLIGNEDVFRDYLKQLFQEFYEDNVMYLELRCLLNEGYRDDGTQMTPNEMLTLYQEVIHDFKSQNPEWYGVRIIYNAIRTYDLTLEEADKYLDRCVELQNEFPDLVIGFDFVGQEDPGRRLTDYIPTLLSHKDKVNYFFHAGETNWNGQTSDNLIDAVLLDTKRIGHGFGITKHPKVMEIAKKQKIAVEVNPVSNQVLGLVKDLRNHPGAELIARQQPIVISSDDPSFFSSKGVTFDWYEAFIGMTSYNADLHLLKYLAKNSIIYSGLQKHEKKILLKQWEKHWKEFIEETYRKHNGNCSADKICE